MQFTEMMLPVLGVTWHYFADEKTAKALARWAERTTRNRQYPCEAFVTLEDDRPQNERYVVKIRNW